MARGGVAGVTTRQIVQAAGQRNVSAVSYYFGSREGLLRALLARRGAPIDAARAAERAKLGQTPTLPELLGCLVVPYCSMLHDPGGRAYVRIVAQMRGSFAAWRLESDPGTSVHLGRIIDEIEQRPEVPAQRRRPRVLAMVMLLTSMTAERARVLDDRGSTELTHDEFVHEMISTSSALLGAPL